MSNIIRRYKDVESNTFLEVKATIGECWARDVCFSIYNNEQWLSIRLSEKQVRDLISALQKRLCCEEDYSATDTSKFDISDTYINADGEVIECE